MIVCSCTVITDRDIESALVEILNAPNAPIPTPGIVYRHLSKRMNCCSCAPVAVETIYNKVDELEKKGLISPTLSATTRSKLLAFTTRRPVPRVMTKNSDSAAQASESSDRDVA